MDKPSPAAPTPEEAQARIHRVEELAASNAPMDELVAAVRAVHLGCTIKIVTAEAGKRFFRAVKMTDKPVVKSRVSYPIIWPEHLVSAFGRKKSAGKPFVERGTRTSGAGPTACCAFEQPRSRTLESIVAEIALMSSSRFLKIRPPKNFLIAVSCTVTLSLFCNWSQTRVKADCW
jgi:hypothetical protein